MNLIKKIKAPIGDENVLVLLQILLEYTIKKIKAPIGDENLLPTVVSSFLHSIKKIKAPIGDENSPITLNNVCNS